jgi:hypothetical protein
MYSLCDVNVSKMVMVVPGVMLVMHKCLKTYLVWDYETVRGVGMVTEKPGQKFAHTRTAKIANLIPCKFF